MIVLQIAHKVMIMMTFYIMIMMRGFDNFRYGVRSMAPVGVWVPWAEVLMLASRFGMDAHTCEAAAQVWAGFGLAELDPLPRDCKYPTDYARFRLLPAGEETDVLYVSSQSGTDPQLCELSLSSDEEPYQHRSREAIFAS